MLRPDAFSRPRGSLQLPAGVTLLSTSCSQMKPIVQMICALSLLGLGVPGCSHSQGPKPEAEAPELTFDTMFAHWSTIPELIRPWVRRLPQHAEEAIEYNPDLETTAEAPLHKGGIKHTPNIKFHFSRTSNTYWAEVRSWPQFYEEGTFQSGRPVRVRIPGRSLINFISGPFRIDESLEGVK